MKTLSKENKTVVGYIIIGICLVVFGALMTSALALKKDAYDPESLCRDKVSAHTIIVLDKTDSLSNNHQRFIRTYITREKDNLETSEKLSIFALTENTYMDFDPIFSKCNPGTGKAANELYQNPRKIQMRFESLFSKPLEGNIDNMLSDNTGSQSPIFEMIKELTLRDDFGDDIEQRTLIIISDMMHHTSEYSHYKNSIKYEYFSKKPYAYEVATSLNSVNVKIVYLLRDKLGNVQGKHHLSFWKDYFEDMGAEVAIVRNVR
ncbi:hypothetical protein ACFL2E_13265 [Thermodesulfobacteriota bacterium]